MDSRRVVPGGLAVLLAVTLFSTCDNNKLTEGWALYAFGTGRKPLEDIYSPPDNSYWPAEDTYSPSEDTYSPREDAYSPREDTYSLPGETWTDPTSGLTWQVTPTGGYMSWAEAKTHCSNLDLDGGGWHLPTIGELRTLIRGCPATQVGGTCKIEEGYCSAWSCWDDSCSGCRSGDGPGNDGMYWPDEVEGPRGWYWSSSPLLCNEASVWVVSFEEGFIFNSDVGSDKLVRCVR